MRYTLTAVFAVLVMLVCLFATLPARALEATAVDGDTFRMDGKPYRIVGIDAPELFGARCLAEKDLALLAKIKLQQLLRHNLAEVTVFPGKDKYGRGLAQVRIGGENINDTLMEDFLAVAYDCPKNRCPRRINWCQP